MDNINETITENFESAEAKRARKPSSNSDFVIRLEAGSGMQTSGMLGKLVPVFAFGLIAVTALQCYQTKMILDQQKQTLELLKIADQRYENLVASYGETVEALADGIDKLASNPVVNPNVSATPEVETIVPSQEEERAVLGVSIMQDGSENTAIGVRIYGIYEASPAQKAGLRAGDIIMSIDKISIDSYTTLSAILDGKVPGDKIMLQYARTENNTVYFHEAEIELVSSLNFDFSKEPTTTP